MLQLIGSEIESGPFATPIAKIESGIAQYASHSREVILLARNPFNLGVEHLVLVSAQGAGFITFDQQRGNVRAASEGAWTVSDLSQRDRHIDNPLDLLERGRTELLKAIQETGAKVDQEESKNAIEKFASCTKGIIVFDEAQSVRLVDRLKPSFEVLTLSQATARTAYHLPNLLHLINTGVLCFSREFLLQLRESLERSASERAPERTPAQPEPAKVVQKESRPSRFIALGVVALLVVALITYLVADSDDGPPAPDIDRRDTLKTPTERPIPNSSVVILVPEPTQLFISARVFETRSALDQAILNGQGLRSLPTKEHRITMDSIRFAEGVYGYFKVQSEWRRGKLLQTFRSRDTFIIDNFLPPLRN